ncbi:hypothetical protein [Microbacterium saperdae]|uniref:hypothetical protein n=1 Tax=Microbacterium saperdae TaxID=69368 RepID=UPI00115197D3|nr:hypothetical protein [Microbacterium saperdae]GGM53279.1 hypothetical protein GCM10010489_26150 [Microbacterium saperdae]
MPRLHSAHRPPLAVCFIALSAVGILGCSPIPEPEPSPTPAFASEEEAFAAAEETYRAYIDAGNARISGSSTPDPRLLLTGSALEADIDTANLLSEKDLHLEGEASLASFTGTSTLLSSSPEVVSATVCIIAANTRLVDVEGNDVTPADRPDASSLEVTFVHVDDMLLISDSTVLDGADC